jgi:hypothetical protein
MKIQATTPTLHRSQTRVVLCASLFLGLAGLGNSASGSLAQSGAISATSPQTVNNPNSPPAGRSVARTAVQPHPTSAKPTWQDLTAAQQQALRPLGPKWHELSQERKRKWLEVSKNFSSLPPAEQAKMHSRMNEWVSLSRHQRAQARINFAETQKLSPAEKSAKWQAYQDLSPEEKRKLAAKAPAKPAGAAIVKPQSAPKLANVPVTRKTHQHGNTADASIQTFNQSTLLPKSETVSGPVEVKVEVEVEEQ